MSNLNTMATFQLRNPKDQLYMFTPGNSVCILTSCSESGVSSNSHHSIKCNVPVFDSVNCGLIPLVTRNSQGIRVRTSGLKWNLNENEPLRFGGLISTSNQVMYDDVSNQASINVEILDGGSAILLCIENSIKLNR